MSAEAQPAAIARDRTTPAKGDVQVIGPWRPGVLPRFAEVWRFKSLYPHMANELIMRRYRKTYLGWLWIPLRPAINIASGGVVFGGLLQVDSGDRPHIIYFAFASAGWVIFERSLHWATRSVRMAGSFSGGAQFPRAMVVVASAAPAFVDFILYAIVAIIVTFYFLVFKGTNYLAPPAQMIVGVAGLFLLVVFGLCV